VRRQALEPLVEQPRALARLGDLAEVLELAVVVAAQPDAEDRRPPLSRSSVAVSRASLCGRRRETGVTSGPIARARWPARSRSARSHGSATGSVGGE
jgi:hypothetical protein